MKRLREISSLQPIFCISFLYIIATGIISYLLPLQLEGILKDVFFVGLFMSFANAFCLIFDIPIGDFTDLVKKKTVIMDAFLLLIACSFVFSTTGFIPGLLLAAGVWMVSQSMMYIAQTAYLMENTKKQIMGKVFGVAGFIENIGWGLAPLVVGCMAVLKQNEIFVVAGLIYAFSFILSNYLKPDKGQGGIVNVIKDVIEKDGIIAREFNHLKLLDLPAWVILSISVFLTVWDGVLWTIGPLYAKALEFSLAQGGLLISAFTLPACFSNILGGYISDKIGAKKILAFSLLFTAVSLFLFTQYTSFNEMLAFAALASIGAGIASPALTVLLSTISPKGRKGFYAGVYTFSTDIGYTAAPLLAGLLGQISMQLPFIFCSALILVGTALATLFKERN